MKGGAHGQFNERFFPIDNFCLEFAPTLEKRLLSICNNEGNLLRPVHRPYFQPTLITATLALAFNSVSGQTAASVPSPADKSAAVEQPLETVTIIGRGQSNNYFDANGSGGATKNDTPLREVPQAVREVTRQFLDDVGAVRLNNVLDYVAGATRQNNFGGNWDNVAIRGFAGNENTGMSMLRNGMAANRGFNAPRDTANVDRIEFLKGTVSALYGISEPGGTVNIITKQPSFMPTHSVEAYYGSYDYKRLAFDSTGPLNGDAQQPASLAYRLNVAAEDKDSFRDYIHNKRELVAPAIAWKVGQDTTVRYDGEWLRQRAPLDRGVVSVRGQLDVVPISRFFGEPADGDITIENQTHQFFVEHALSSALQVRAGLQYRHATLNGYASEGQAPGGGTASVNNTGLLWRRLRYRDYHSADWSSQINMLGKLTLGDLQHDLVLGTEAFRFNIDQLLKQQPSAQWPTYGINIYNPIYGQARPNPTITATDNDESDRSTAIYAQDQISLSPQWKLLAGVRHDRYRQHIDNWAAHTFTNQEPSATSPRLGFTWLPNQTLSAYASVGRSFRPNMGTDANGAAFDPEKGTAHEVGMKWQSPDERLGGSVSLFDIKKNNVLVPNPNNPDFSIAAGEVRNKGLEFELAGQIARNWRVAVSYAYLNSELTQFPRHSGSTFVMHEMPLEDGTLLGLGGGFTHVGERTGDTGVPVLPAYTIAKLTGYWRISKTLRLSLNVDNVFDKTYYASAYNNVWVTPGSPRTFTLGLQAKF